MSSDKRILISGAGPSGMALAIFLAEKGYRPRIVDKKREISPWSKAFGVNPRSLEILEPYGITERFLQNGRKMKAMNIWRNDKLFFRNEISKLKHRYPFMLIQSQRESELILQKEVAKRGIEIESGTQFMQLEKTSDCYRSTLLNEETFTFDSDYVIGADGSHSEVRTQAGIEFTESGYRGTWELYDVELDINIPPDDANLFFSNHGGMILIRIKDNLWRVAGSMKDLLNYLPKGTKTGKIPWQAKFHIGHRIAKQLTKDNLVLIGDAAHIHSPFGGRGMNLGLEDAFLVAKAIHENRILDYNQERLPFLKSTLNRINLMTTFIVADSGFPLFMKKSAWLAKPFLPLARPAIRKFVSGLH